MRLMKLAKKYKLYYTRYADDLTFSTNNKFFIGEYNDFLTEITKEIERAGFIVNEKKTRLQFKDSRQEVTGLIVNKKVNISRQYYKTTKSLAHHLYQGNNIFVDNKDITESAINVISGRFGFIDQVLKENNKYDGEKHSHKKLNSKEKEYKKFLFYKTFYSNSKPLIVTEGKTDIVHLKSAIKSLYDGEPSKYKRLVSKQNGKYYFKVNFLNKTKKLKYFLNISQDGGDALNVISQYYAEREYNSFNPVTNFPLYFNKLSGQLPNRPVILLFDNEVNSKDSPLGKYLSKRKNIDLSSMRDVLKNRAYSLYTMTFRLPSDGEIEDLYSKEVLNEEIDGRKFDRKGNNGGFGKAIFSVHIAENYKKVNFSNFVPLVESIMSILEDYEKINK